MGTKTSPSATALKNLTLTLTLRSNASQACFKVAGYTGLDSTPRRHPYRRVKTQRRNLKSKHDDTACELPHRHHITVHVIHLIVVILVAASLCFGVLIGTMNKDRTNMKYQAIQFGSERVGEGLVIIDGETGELLGGKRAAIQFYHDKQSKGNVDLQM